MSHELRKNLTVLKGTSVLLSIVIGAGLLTLPGLAVERVGEQAVLSWIICIVASLPLLTVFIILGRRYPDAGGLTSYARRAFGSYGSRLATFLFLGAVIFGLPSIALSGGYYLSAVVGSSPHILALGLLIGALIPHLIPGDGASAFMSWIASLVIAAIVLFVVFGIVASQTSGENIQSIDLSPTGWMLAFTPFTMLFFAFTGWEVGAGIAEEFRNPERDFPLAMVASFIIATILYLAVAYVAMSNNLHGRYEAPFVEIVRPILGHYGAASVGAVAALIVFANLSGAVWGVSRMVFGLARSGELPRILARTRNGTPLVAVSATVFVLSVVLILAASGAFDVGSMLAIAGQNFLILYGLSAAALFSLSIKSRDRLLSVLVLFIVGALLILQGFTLLYPALLIGIATVVEWIGRRRKVSF